MASRQSKKKLTKFTTLEIRNEGVKVSITGKGLHSLEMKATDGTVVDQKAGIGPKEYMLERKRYPAGTYFIWVSTDGSCARETVEWIDK